VDIVEESRRLAKEMSEKYGKTPPFDHTELIVKKGQELAKKLGADEKIVTISCYLIDVGLSKAYQKGKIKEHTKISSEMAKDFLNKFNLSKKEKEKIINCIEAHHGKVKHNCIESEIVKNADNFRFLDPTGLFISLYWAKETGRNLSEWVKLAKEKVEEKYKLVTLDICKKETEENYKLIKEFLNRVNI
jgi:HD superfamily phosphodiesterase